jgi:hypothetical protein
MILAVLSIAVGLGIAGLAYLISSRRASLNTAVTWWNQVAAASDPCRRTFELSLIEGQPEVVRRYFLHAIALGTPLKTVVELKMEGTFLFGDLRRFQTYKLDAHEILAAPREFVWLASMSSGVMHVSGSDALVGGEALGSFWIAGFLPFAQLSASSDQLRSAQFRAAMDSVWAPASLLPGDGITWTEVNKNVARVKINAFPQPLEIDLTLSPTGSILAISGNRWNNVTEGDWYQMQGFGGTIEGEKTFEGYTIPSVIKLGSHFGTEAYFPYLQAEIVWAGYL